MIATRLEPQQGNESEFTALCDLLGADGWRYSGAVELAAGAMLVFQRDTTRTRQQQGEKTKGFWLGRKKEAD